MRNLPRLGWRHWVPLVALVGACKASPTVPTAAHGVFVEASIYCEPAGVDEVVREGK